jgi:hypothetical protein
MKQKLATIFLLLFALSSTVIFIREASTRKPEIKLEEIKEDTSTELPSKPSSVPIIDEINKINESIKSFYCEDVEVRIWENGHRFRLQGVVAYKKNLNFHMDISSIFGKEVDLGANEKEFWYWSRRDRRPGLYWAVYADFNKTRLKTPFNPMFMKSTLGLENIDYLNAKVTESQKRFMITFPREDSMGRNILYSVFVDKEKSYIDGFLITSIDGKKLVECTIEKKSDSLPSKINYIWHEENRIMTLEFKKPKINVEIPESHFMMPSISPKINMADE